MNPELNQAEFALYKSDPFCWSVYTALKYATGTHKRALWDLLDDKQQDELRTLARMKK